MRAKTQLFILNCALAVALYIIAALLWWQVLNPDDTMPPWLVDVFSGVTPIVMLGTVLFLLGELREGRSNLDRLHDWLRGGHKRLRKRPSNRPDPRA